MSRRARARVVFESDPARWAAVTIRRRTRSAEQAFEVVEPAALDITCADDFTVRPRSWSPDARWLGGMWLVERRAFAGSGG